MRVIDRRMFTADGELREEVRQELAQLEASRPAEPAEPPPSATPAPRESAALPDVPAAAPEPPVPAVEEGPADPSFARLVMTLSNQAGLCLGLLVDPLNPGGTVDLQAAKVFIDMLAVIQKKTAGRLNTEEANILESVLYELQLAYVEKSRRPARG